MRLRMPRVKEAVQTQLKSIHMYPALSVEICSAASLVKASPP